MVKTKTTQTRALTIRRQQLSTQTGWVGLMGQVSKFANIFPVGGKKAAQEDIFAPYYDQVGFGLSILALGNGLAVIDGTPNQKEFNVFRASFPLVSAGEESLSEYFMAEQKNNSAPLFYVRHIVCILNNNAGLCEELLQRLIALSLADGAPHAREIHLLHMISEELGVDGEKFTKMFIGQLHTLAQNPYELLDVSRRVATENIRSVYHHRLKALHPDTLQRYTTDATVMDVVHESLSTLRKSYHKLCKRRGIR